MRKRNRMMCTLLAAVLSVSALAPCSMPVYAQERAVELTEAEGKSEVIPNDETGIPDKGLYQVILQEIGKPKDGVITREDAEKITSIDHNNSRHACPDVKSLKGIGYLKNLRSLWLEYHKLKSLEGIEELEKLEYLAVSGNQLKSLKPAAQCTRMRVLIAADNELTSLDGIGELTEISYLEVQNNKMKSIQGIQNLTKLEYLNVSENSLSDLKPVKGLPRLKGLVAGYNRLKKLPDLTKMGTLTTLDLSHNRLSEKEISKKTPRRFRKNGKKKTGWMINQTQYQNLDYKVRLSAPSSVNKITTKTTRIVGKALPNARVTLYSRSHDKKLGTAKADKNGNFVMSRLNLKKYAGKAEFVVMLENKATGVWETVKRKNECRIRK